MANGPWLLLDMSNLAWRAFHTTGHLSFNGNPTGVIYGVFRELVKLRDRFPNGRPVFCFDVGESLRKKKYPWYKCRLPNPDRKTVRQQLDQLMLDVLPAVGFRNLFHADGYEADDIIASVVTDDLKHLKYLSVMVSGDQDLYQLLRVNCHQYHPATGELMTQSGFYKRYGFNPAVGWAEVKAIAGCKSDTIPGAKGVGEAGACQYVAGTLKSGAKFNNIKLWVESGQFDETMKLTKLPYPGCPTFDLRDDQADTDKWNRQLRRFGIRSLR